MNNEFSKMANLDEFLVAGYREAVKDFPVCNHNGAHKENIGYTQGIMADGIPFEAECWACGNEKTISIIMPEIEAFQYPEKDESGEKDQGKEKGFRSEIECHDGGILCIGMVDNGQEKAFTIIERYVRYLEENEVVLFNSTWCNGSVFYRTDILGNDLVEVKVTLKDTVEEYGDTALGFRPYPGTPRMRIIKGGK